MCHVTLNNTCQICWSWIETPYIVSLCCTAFAKKRFPILFRASAVHLSSTKCHFFLLGVHTNALKASKTFSYLIGSSHLAEWWPSPPYCFPLSHQETSTGMCLLDHCLQLWKKEEKNKCQCMLTFNSNINFPVIKKKDIFVNTFLTPFVNAIHILWQYLHSLINYFS